MLACAALRVFVLLPFLLCVQQNRSQGIYLNADGSVLPVAVDGPDGKTIGPGTASRIADQFPVAHAHEVHDAEPALLLIPVGDAQPDRAGELVGKLNAQDDRVRRLALDEIIDLRYPLAINDPRVVEALIALLNDKWAWGAHRELVVRALAATKAPRAVARLISELDVEETRAIAAMGLADIGDPQAVEPMIDALGLNHTELYPAFKKMGAPVVEPLLARLKSPNKNTQCLAVGGLAYVGDPRAVEPLVGLLNDPSKSVRHCAIGALSKFKDTRVVEPLVRLLRDPDRDTRGEAACALGAWGDAWAVSPLIGALKDRDPEVRRCAARSLGRFRDPSAVPPLIAAIADRESKVREGAANSLGQLQDLRAVPSLIAALADRESTVRVSAANSLGQLQDVRAVAPLILALRDRDVSVRAYAVRGLVKAGEPGVEPLIAVLADPNPDVRRRAAYVLDSIGDPRAASALVTALRVPDLAVISGAHRFFIERGEPDSEDALIAALYKFGTSEMSENYLNCGNEKLRAAGRNWALHFRYQILQFPTSGGESPKWGRPRTTGYER
jgi:HEAT repeat protein